MNYRLSFVRLDIYQRSQNIYSKCTHYFTQLGQASVNPPDLCLKWGDFNFAGSHAWEAELPPSWNFELSPVLGHGRVKWGSVVLLLV